MWYIKKLLHTFLKQWQLTEQITSQLLEKLEDVLTLVEDYSLLLAFSKSAGLKREDKRLPSLKILFITTAVSRKVFTSFEQLFLWLGKNQICI